MNKRNVLVVIAALCTLSTIFAASVSGVSIANARQTHRVSAATTALPPVPAVPNARTIRKRYAGQSITFVGDTNIGSGHAFDVKIAQRFQKDTGIKVNIIEHPAASDASYQQLARNFSSKSSALDVVMLDVVWPGAFAPYLLNLRPYFGKTISKWYSGAVNNDTIAGKMIAAPYFGDFGMLYYRTDLLKKYGYSSPPTTWAQLTTMAKKIQTGEQKKNSHFSGFVFQGAAYEGLTCDSLEWLASSGGGKFFAGKKVTVNNANAVKMLKLAQSWIGSISPAGVTNYQETETENAWLAGDAAFARNWPYMYGDSILPAKSKVVGKFDVAPLPRATGHSPVGTLGGWQLGVSRYSKHPGAAVEFLRYLTGAPVSKYRAINGAYVPLVKSVATNPQVTKKLTYLGKMAGVDRVTRPSKFLKGNYIRGSTYIFQDMNSILRGADPSSVLSQLEQQLNRLVR